MTVVLGILAVLLILVAIVLAAGTALFALSVVLSFAIAWHERTQSDPAVGFRHRPALAARLLLGEFVCLLLTLLLRPLGWLPAGIPAGAGRRRPVILLHGLFQNRSCLLLLQWRLRAAGFDRVISINTPPWRDLETLVDTIAATVEAVRQGSGCDQVDLVGHSMGGILARCYLQLRNGTANVSNCVTIGSPHGGTRLAPFAVSTLGRAMVPGSPLLSRLNRDPLPVAVHWTAISSRHDNIIVPAACARLEGADNVQLTGLGHTAMLFSRQTAWTVISALGDRNN